MRAESIVLIVGTGEHSQPFHRKCQERFRPRMHPTRKSRVGTMYFELSQHKTSLIIGDTYPYYDL